MPPSACAPPDCGDGGPTGRRVAAHVASQKGGASTQRAGRQPTANAAQKRPALGPAHRCDPMPGARSTKIEPRCSHAHLIPCYMHMPCTPMAPSGGRPLPALGHIPELPPPLHYSMTQCGVAAVPGPQPAGASRAAGKQTTTAPCPNCEASLIHTLNHAVSNLRAVAARPRGIPSRSILIAERPSHIPSTLGAKTISCATAAAAWARKALLRRVPRVLVTLPSPFQVSR
jgi:hypothetical protein